MLIGIDASRATVSQRTGVEGYSLNVLQGVMQAAGDHRFRLYFRDEPQSGIIPAGAEAEQRVITRPRLWTHTGLGVNVRQQKPDVLFVPSHVLPWPGLGGVPGVVTVHDLGYLHYPDKHPFFDRLYLNWSTRHSAGLARRVIAVSHATAQDLINLLNIPKEKVRVVHSGVDEMLHPVKDPAVLRAVREKHGIPGPYILHVGSLRPRKNLPNLVAAFDRIKDVVDNLTLVLAGSQSWGHQRVVERVEALGLDDRVILPGYVPDSDLPALYSGASVYAFPSLYEGFGFPALEAMACHTPVVCSNTSSLPELVGEAALTFPPTDVERLADTLRRVLTEPELCRHLIEQGERRAAQFTWEACARETLAVIEEAASGV